MAGPARDERAATEPHRAVASRPRQRRHRPPPGRALRWRYVKGGYGAEIDEHIPAGTPEQEARDLERIARRHGVPVESLSTVIVPDTNLTATRDLLRDRPAALGLALIVVLCLAAIAWRTAGKGPRELVGIVLVLGSGLGMRALRWRSVSRPGRCSSSRASSSRSGLA